jgi:hypothetical protein
MYLYHSRQEILDKFQVQVAERVRFQVHKHRVADLELIFPAFDILTWACGSGCSQRPS